jgi:hypothetical protein
MLAGLIDPRPQPPSWIYQATLNYWGPTACVPSPPTQPLPCFGGFFNNPAGWNYLPVAPPASTCQASAEVSLPNACPYWTQYFSDQSGFFGSPCDSLIALYNREVTCGHCEQAIAFLEEAINACDDIDQATLNRLLSLLTGTNGHCHGRYAGPLAQEISWLQSYGAAADSAYKQHAAVWAIGQAFSAMQCFDSAAALYAAIASANWAPPQDSAAAGALAALQLHLRDIEGNSDSCGGAFGKVRAQAEYRGRVGEAIPADPLLMQVYPNPFTNETEIVFTLPEDDRVEVRVYNQAAQDVTTLMSETSVKGRHTVRFAAAGLAPGVYYVAVHTSNFQECKSIVLKK